VSRRALSGVQIRSDQISKEGYRANLSVVISWLLEDFVGTSLPSPPIARVTTSLYDDQVN
jgi:hypothetical protein